MSAFSAVAGLTAINSNHLRTVSITRDNALDFYRLMQEQAAQHASANTDASQESVMAERLYLTAIENKGINAFMVCHENVPLGAATFIRSQTEEGSSLYLEDLITTERARSRGIGRFSMSALSQIALRRGYKNLLWECAAHNVTAQKFYTGIGADIYADRDTWRCLGPTLGRNRGEVSRHYVVSEISRASIHDAVRLIQGQTEKPSSKFLADWLHSEAVAPHANEVFLIARRTETNNIVGMTYGYRNYSTFRMCCGLHINGLFFSEGHEAAATALMQELSLIQDSRGWNGHTDITLKQGQSNLRNILTTSGYAPLTYGDDRMIVRRLGGDQLERLAAQCPMTVNDEIVANVPERAKFTSPSPTF
ncbi:MAG: GNAT family N-acetyltransferase [Alphaproteobacteria bacterium]|nr:GNAT family N-acetyltransferase [Alphaproteobacteria bacterium]